ncbi:MAG: acyloxyacyl hydrolase [Thermoanaerobaculia bacterium]
MKLDRLLFLIAFIVVTTPMSAADSVAYGRTFTVFLGDGRSIQGRHGQATMQSLHMEWAQPFRWKTQIALDLAPYSFRQPRSWFGDTYHDGHETARAIAAALLLRRTFRPQSSVRTYVELGTGPMVGDKPVPAATSHFNFATQAGVGVMLMARADFGIFAGYRFWHVSNGGLVHRNPGLNVNGIVIGSRLVAR